MILKLRVVLKDNPAREVAWETELIVDDEEQARAAGEEFWTLAYAAAEGIDTAADKQT